MIAVYEAGYGLPAPKPAALTGAEKCQRVREKERALSSDRGLAAQLVSILQSEH